MGLELSEPVRAAVDRAVELVLSTAAELQTEAAYAEPEAPS
jgi:hypothetical protein